MSFSDALFACPSNETHYYRYLSSNLTYLGYEYGLLLLQYYSAAILTSR